MVCKAVVIAGTHSGSGKTTVSIGLMAALKRQGLIVQPFKIGPDYIDPGFHSAACGTHSYNLDTWMMGEEGVRETFFNKTRTADIALIEGVMGLFDGRNDPGATSSTAHVAKVLELPVILVVDGGKMAQSAGAIVYGFENYMPGLQVAGVIFNNVAGVAHYGMLREAVEEKCRAEALGYVQRDPEISIPERHLGLVSSGEKRDLPEILDNLAGRISSQIDIDGLLRISMMGWGKTASKTSLPASPRIPTPCIRVAVALDDAFWFYYQENFDILRSAGAEIVFFSPLHDEGLPPNIDCLYLGGGYPELHARRLSDNRSMIRAVREWAMTGCPVYTECGGFMYLTEGIYDLNNDFFEMAGVFTASARMSGRRLRLGYQEVEFLQRTILGDKGDRVRGHEFHYSELLACPENAEKIYNIMGSGGEGYRVANTFSSYLHIHFRSNSRIGENFVTFCKGKGRGQNL